MKRLILLRHAKSSWKTGLDDHDRPLNKRGRRNAPFVGEWIADRGWRPQMVYCSTAVRAKATVEAMLGAWDHPPVHLDASLYMGGVDEIVACVANHLGTGPVLVAGHNPGWEDAVHDLTGHRVRLTTCNAAVMTTPATSWADAMVRPWDLVAVLRPRDPK